MKTLLFALLISLGITLIPDETDAQCPPNWNYVSIPLNEPGGCDFQVEFCYICGPSGIEHNIKVLNIHPNNGCLAPDKDWFISELRDKFIDYCTLPPCPGQPCIDIVIEFPLCFQCYTEGSYYNG